MLHIINLLIHNGQGYRLGKVQTDFSKFPHHLYLRDIVIHSAVVFTHKQKETFLQLFFKLLHDPATAKVLLFLISDGCYTDAFIKINTCSDEIALSILIHCYISQ